MPNDNDFYLKVYLNRSELVHPDGTAETFEEGAVSEEAWDAKYAISYLRDQLEELDDKLRNHPQVTLAGFVTTVAPIRMDELLLRMEEIQDMRGIKVVILTLDQWVQAQFQRTYDEVDADAETLAGRWLVAYSESIAQRRREIAPIDEPCFDWLAALKHLIVQAKV